MNKPYYQDLHNTLYQMDFRANDLPDESVQMVVTSPPYWGLRKYSGEQDLIWGGDKDCKHEWVDRKYLMHSGRGDAQKSGKYSTQEPIPDMPMGDNTCSLCGAWKGAYGLEPTPEMYVQHTVEILREIRRVLRKDGVVFWNIGDSYASQGGPVKSSIYDIMGGSKPTGYEKSRTAAHSSIKPKDLCLIPFRIAIAAQTDGWYVRSVIIWNKPNPMPESVTDRPTESHEYILMLTKNKTYYWDQEAVREPLSPAGEARYDSSLNFGQLNKRQEDEADSGRTGRMLRGELYKPNGRNLRSVWSFPTRPYPEAHFAVFPEKLPELCIKAATPEAGCCSKCGAPWERIAEKIRAKPQRENWRNQEGAEGRSDYSEAGGWYDAETKTTGWQPTCKCNADKVPSIVLDPFAGAGTTLWVAKKLNRKGIGFDISEEYCRLAVARIRQQVML